MTVPLASSATLFNGIREFGQVTNSFAGYLQSAGTAYDLTLPFQADLFQWFRYTGYGTAGTLAQGVWFRGFPDGDSLIQRAIVDNGATGNSSCILETTNGVTISDLEGGFTATQKTITGITTGAPAVVTVASHGLSDGDRVFITKVVGSMANEINNQQYVVQVLTANTFALYDIYGLPIVTVGSYTSGGQINLAGPRLGTVNNRPTYKLTLGSSIMGADNDVIYFVAWQFNNYQNFGDVA